MRKISHLLICLLILVLSSTCLLAQSSDQTELEKIDRELQELEIKRVELEKRRSQAKLKKLKAERDEIDRKIKELEQTGDTAEVPPIDKTQKPVKETEQIDTVTEKDPANFVKKVSSDTRTDSGKKSQPKPAESPTISDSAKQQTSGQKAEKTESIYVIADKLAQLLYKVRKESPVIKLNENESQVTNMLSKKLFQVESEKTDKEVRNAVLDVEAFRSDKLLGSTAKSNGTTTLVSKGGIPLIFSLATEYGGAVSSTNGTSTTFQFNPVGLTDQLSQRPEFPNSDRLTCANAKGLREKLCRMSLGLTFDLSRGVDTPEFNGSKEQLSQISFRYKFTRTREPSVSGFFTSVNKSKLIKEKFLNTNLNVSTEQRNAVEALIDYTKDEFEFKIEALQNWLNGLNDKLANLNYVKRNNEKDPTDKFPTKEAAADIQEIKEAIVSSLDNLPVAKIKEDQNTADAIKDFGAAADLYLLAKQEYVKDIYRERMVTFEYTNNRELMSPDSSNFLLIAEQGFGNGMDFTFNGSFALFHGKPEVGGMITADNVADFKRLRDFSFATQLDIPLFGVPSISDSSFSLAAKYQRMNSGTFFFNDMAFDDLKGDILVGQLKLNLAIGKSGLFLPLSFTYSNRSELNKEKESRGNFGFTFDVSSILKKYMNGLLIQ